MRIENIEIIEQPDFGYQLLGFKHNHRTTADVEAGTINPDNWVPNKKLSNPVVRQAIAYAVNREGLVGEGHGKGLLHGRGQPINSPIATQFWAYDDAAAVNYTYDPAKAGEMLDEIGYVDVNGDGFREDPDGNEWILNYGLSYWKPNYVKNQHQLFRNFLKKSELKLIYVNRMKCQHMYQVLQMTIQTGISI